MSVNKEIARRLDQMAALPVNRRLIGDDAQPFALEIAKAGRDCDLETGLHPLLAHANREE